MIKTKNLLFYCTFLLCAPCYADVIEIHDIQKTDLEGVFALINDSTETKTVLDCVSFIHNLTIKQKDKSIVYNISNQECISDLRYLMDTPDERRCLNYGESGYFLSDCT